MTFSELSLSKCCRNDTLAQVEGATWMELFNQIKSQFFWISELEKMQINTFEHSIKIDILMLFPMLTYYARDIVIVW